MTDELGELEVIAAGFSEPAQAEAAEAALRGVLDVGDADLSVGAIGGSAEVVDGYRSILAGRIRKGRLTEVFDIIRRLGGTVLTEIPAARTNTNH